MRDAFDPCVLTESESRILTQVEKGEVARFGWTRPTIRAAFLRHLLLKLPVPGRTGSWPIQLPGVRIHGVCIEGSLDISDAAQPGIGLPTLTLEYCSIPEPKAQSLILRGPVQIDLCGMRVATMEWSSQGWGLDGENGKRCTINFDGFEYERIFVEVPQHISRDYMLRQHFGIPYLFGPPKSTKGDPLLDWILHQSPSGPDPDRNFLPQPYRQLVRVLRSQGEEATALTIAVAERWAARWAANRDGIFSLQGDLIRAVLASIRWIFGVCFGFGLLRLNASLTLLSYALVGMFGVCLAETNGMLVESAIVTAPVFIQSYAGGEMRAFVPYEKSDRLYDLRCTDTANNLGTDFVYAADMIVPFIPLHQEAKCEIKPGGASALTAWRMAKAVYSVLGWIVFSLCLATFSGLLRRHVGEA